jgi:hypothetical protein
MDHELAQIATKLAQGLPVVLPAGWRFTPLLHEQEHQIPTVPDQRKAEKIKDRPGERGFSWVSGQG